MTMTIGDRRTFFGMANPVDGYQTPLFTHVHLLYKASFKALSVKAKTNGLSPVCFDKNSYRRRPDRRSGPEGISTQEKKAQD